MSKFQKWSNSSVKFWRQLYENLGFDIFPIAPLCKTIYPDIDAWKGFASGGNIAINTVTSRMIALDVDAGKLSPLMNRVAKSTLTVKTPKGFGIILDGEIPEPYFSPLYAVNLNNKGEWSKVDVDQYNIGLRLVKSLARLGLKDDTAIHASFPNTDGYTYILLPPSVTCRWQGYKATVRGHTTYVSECNSSPTKKHDFRMRTFYHYTEDLLDWNHFAEMVNLEI